jgi:hypothetical protein
MDWDDDDYGIDLTEEDAEAVAFEKHFYKLLSGTDEVQVLPMSKDDEFTITEEDIKLISIECKKNNIKLLYRISHGQVATVFDPNTGNVGVMPEFNSVGFPC